MPVAVWPASDAVATAPAERGPARADCVGAAAPATAWLERAAADAPVAVETAPDAAAAAPAGGGTTVAVGAHAAAVPVEGAATGTAAAPFAAAAATDAVAAPTVAGPSTAEGALAAILPDGACEATAAAAWNARMDSRSSTCLPACV